MVGSEAVEGLEGGAPALAYQRVDVQPLHRSVVQQITRRIVTGDLQPEDTLPVEPRLADQFGVSKTVIREAVRVLVSMGLIKVKQGSGMQVQALNEWDYLDPLILFEQVRSGHGEALLDEVLEMRRVLEVEAAGLAAERRTSGDLDELRTCVMGMEKALRDPEEFTRLDIEFHELMMSAGRNRLLREALRPVKEVLKTGRFITNRNTIRQGGAEKSQRGHEEIYTAIEHEDGEAAREAMRRHVKQFERDIRASLNSPEVWEGAT